MPLHVQGQVIAACKAALADDALERLGARVLSVVSRKLVRSGEPPLALGPLACVRLLTCEMQIKKRHGLVSVMFGVTCGCWAACCVQEGIRQMIYGNDSWKPCSYSALFVYAIVPPACSRRIAQESAKVQDADHRSQ